MAFVYQISPHYLASEILRISKSKPEAILSSAMMAWLKKTILLQENPPSNTAQLKLKDIKRSHGGLRNKVKLKDLLQKTGIKSESAEEVIYIDNAGLILYWIHLKQLFSKIGLLNEKKEKFTGKQASLRGVLLLGTLLQNSALEIPEYDLALNKILCGVSLEEPLPISFDITPAESQECENVTGAILAHWTALGKISQASFIQMFVQRMGVIKENNGQYLLQVEKKAQDILLDRLPWSIHVVKLPWMKNSIMVEW